MDFVLIGLLRGVHGGVALNTDGYTRRSPAHGLQLEYLAEVRRPGVLLHLHVIDRDMMDRDYQRGRVSHREDTKIGASAEIGRNAATAGLRRSGARARDAIVFIISSSLACRTLS